MKEDCNNCYLSGVYLIAYWFLVPCVTGLIVSYIEEGGEGLAMEVSHMAFCTVKYTVCGPAFDVNPRFTHLLCFSTGCTVS